MELRLELDEIVYFNNLKCKIKNCLDLSTVVVEVMETGETLNAKIKSLTLEENLFSADHIITQPHPAILNIEACDWDKAKKREEILGPFLNCPCPRQDAEVIAATLGITVRYVYKLIKRYQQYNGSLSGLIVTKSKGGHGKIRINKEVEAIIHETINQLYFSNQKIKISIVIEEIARRCHFKNLCMPSPITVRRRIATYSQKIVTTKREGAKAAHQNYKPIIGQVPEADFPLKIIQIDHTLVDLIIVDELYRKPIGRPYITVAIDVFSRCITGFCLTLDPPSAVSVGLCLTHAIFEKERWLIDRQIDGLWPIWGKPELIYVDNAKEFHSEALQRGCDLNGIKVKYRPIGQPHWGGIVERLIGTLMQLVHQIPGTTFSNTKERGQYPSEKKAVLTLAELEQWLTIAIVDYYHQKVHSGLKLPPLEQYKIGILGNEKSKGRGYPPRIQNKNTFLIDFLPVERRTLQRDGFRLDHITYYCNSLSSLIAIRERNEKFIIRRDPRDLSRIYVLDPKSQHYLEIPYRTLSRPTITLWEHRKALQFLREKGIRAQDEVTIFAAINKMRNIEKEAVATSKEVRRRQESRKNNTKLNSLQTVYSEDNNHSRNDSLNSPVKIFEDIEVW